MHSIESEECDLPCVLHGALVGVTSELEDATFPLFAESNKWLIVSEGAASTIEDVAKVVGPDVQFALPEKRVPLAGECLDICVSADSADAFIVSSSYKTEVVSSLGRSTVCGARSRGLVKTVRGVYMASSEGLFLHSQGSHKRIESFPNVRCLRGWDRGPLGWWVLGAVRGRVYAFSEQSGRLEDLEISFPDNLTDPGTEVVIESLCAIGADSLSILFVSVEDAPQNWVVIAKLDNKKLIITDIATNELFIPTSPGEGSRGYMEYAGGLLMVGHSASGEMAVFSKGEDGNWKGHQLPEGGSLGTALSARGDPTTLRGIFPILFNKTISIGEGPKAFNCQLAVALAQSDGSLSFHYFHLPYTVPGMPSNLSSGELKQSAATTPFGQAASSASGNLFASSAGSSLFSGLSASSSGSMNALSSSSSASLFASTAKTTGDLFAMATAAPTGSAFGAFGQPSSSIKTVSPFGGFGQSASSSKAPVAAASTGSAFGGFGQPASGSAAATAFGSGFGGFGQPASGSAAATASGSAFGGFGQSASGSKATGDLFAPATATSTGSAFGGFGQPASGSAAGTASGSAFGGFGQSASSSKATGDLYAPATAASTGSAFGGFGQPAPSSAAGTASGGAFGGFGQSASSAKAPVAAAFTGSAFGGFGSGSAAGTASGSAFGGFGQSASSSKATGDLFALATAASTGSAFGGFGQPASASGSAFGGFGQSASSSKAPVAAASIGGPASGSAAGTASGSAFGGSGQSASSSKAPVATAGTGSAFGGQSGSSGVAGSSGFGSFGVGKAVNFEVSGSSTGLEGFSGGGLFGAPKQPSATVLTSPQQATAPKAALPPNPFDLKKLSAPVTSVSPAPIPPAPLSAVPPSVSAASVSSIAPSSILPTQGQSASDILIKWKRENERSRVAGDSELLDLFDSLEQSLQRLEKGDWEVEDVIHVEGLSGQVSQLKSATSGFDMASLQRLGERSDEMSSEVKDLYFLGDREEPADAIVEDMRDRIKSLDDRISGCFERAKEVKVTCTISSPEPVKQLFPLRPSSPFSTHAPLPPSAVRRMGSPVVAVSLQSGPTASSGITLHQLLGPKDELKDERKKHSQPCSAWELLRKIETHSKKLTSLEKELRLIKASVIDNTKIEI